MKAHFYQQGENIMQRPHIITYLLILFLSVSFVQISTYAADLDNDLLVAALLGRTDKVIDLLAKGANVNARNKASSTPLILAAENGHADIVRILLAKGADLTAKNKTEGTALIVAAINGHTNVLHVIQATAINRTEINTFALKFAAITGQTDTVKALLSWGADVNSQGEEGFAVLGSRCKSENGRWQNCLAYGYGE